MFEELLACQVGLVDTLLLESFDDLCLGGNRRMVGTGHPAGVLALQPCTADENILNGFVEHMSHVQHAGHIGRRNDYCKRSPAVRLAVKETFVQPVLVPAAFDVCGIVLGVHKIIDSFSLPPRGTIISYLHIFSSAHSCYAHKKRAKLL